MPDPIYDIGDTVNVLATGRDNKPITPRPGTTNVLGTGTIVGVDEIDGESIYDIRLTTGGLTRSYEYGLERV